MNLSISNENIWNPLIKSAEIILELDRIGSACIDLKGESPAIDETSLPEFFLFLQEQGYDTSKITVLTGNPLENNKQVRIEHNPDAHYEIALLQKYSERIPTHKNIKYYFGNFVSRTNLPRLIIASHLFSNYKDKTFQTFHYQTDNLYHKNHLELDRLVAEYGANSVEFDEAVFLLKNAPILKEEIASYPIIHVNQDIMISPCQWYPNIFVDIICETWFRGTNFYITEKFWRAVATKTPFIIQGPQYVLDNIKKLGFKTFHDFWDEGYSDDPSLFNLNSIKYTIGSIAKEPMDEIVWMYRNMKDIVDHNYEIFMNITKHDIKKRLTLQS
jgi:hypothetical protein